MSHRHRKGKFSRCRGHHLPELGVTSNLIKKGAKLVQKADDIIEELAPAPRGFFRAKERRKMELDDEERKLCDILTSKPMHIGTLSRELFLSAAKALATLFNLETKGVVKQTGGKRCCLVS
ncbi:MAG TPA: hypothetical protein VEE82_00930 [Thermodesulfovibrionales bacterium]|nr:hypothetical protein [Thermodesulfovibrionales bacterium]